MVRIYGNLSFCQAGNHATEDAFEWGGFTWCPKHIAAGDPVDPLLPGFCEWSQRHFAKDGVRWMPPRGAVDGRWLCRPHYSEYVLEIVRRGFWHKT